MLSIIRLKKAYINNTKKIFYIIKKTILNLFLLNNN